jgi:T5SS/PEP-CTERM-associated repeat protein
MRWIVCALASLCAVPAAWGVPAYKGMSYTSFGANTLSGAGSDQSLLNMSMLGTDTVALNFWWFQPDINSSNIAPSASSATIASVEHAIDRIHGLGMKVFLKPMLDVSDGTWRANINPADTDQWFTNYRNFVNTFAAIADDKGVELFSIGCEFNNLENSANNQRWIDTIADVRTHYSGPLTYSANWNNGGIGGGYNAIEWWDQLDKIGIDAYFPVSTTANPSPASLETSWNNTANTIDAWRTANFPEKRVLFTEVGYSSYDGTTMTPYALADGQTSDEAEQAAAYDALLNVMEQREWWDGAFWWNWETNPTPTNSTSFTPQFKLAQEVITEHYGGPGLPYPFTAWSNDAGGQFGTASNWSAGVPNAVFNVEFDRGDNVAYTVAINNNNRTVQQLRVRSGTVTFDSSNATLRSITADDQHVDDVNRSMIIGVDEGDVAVVIAGPTFSSLTAFALTIGDAAGSTGELNLTNSSNRLNVNGRDLIATELIVGREGQGTLNLSNGADVVVTTANTNATIGRDAGSVGVVNLDGAGTTFSSGSVFRVGLNGQATLHVSNGALVSTTTMAVGALGEVFYSGSLTGSISNSGVVHPGNSIGTLTISGNFNQFSTGTLEIEIASNSSYDQLNLSSTANFNGLLKVVLLDNFAPQFGDAFDILDFAFRFGTFATLDLPQLAGNLAWDTSQLYSTGVLSVISAGPSGDFNKDGVVDAADYTVWRNGLGTIYQPEDYGLWKSNFGQGGSGSGPWQSTANVPEPNSATHFLALAAICSLLGAWDRRR